MIRTLAPVAALAASLATSLAPASPAAAEQPAAQEGGTATLSVSGTGRVSVAPNLATLRVGVETQDETAAAALAANSQAAQKVMDTLTGKGVAEKDVQTANFSVYPVYEDTNRIEPRPEGPRVLGYRVTNQVVARIRNLDALGDLLDATVAEGANRIDGLEFGLEDDAAAADEARRRAVHDARRKAETYAEAAGVALDRIRSIDEGGGGPIPMHDMAFRAEAAATSVPVAPGETTVSVTVQIVWEIAPAAR
jgi:uncharacterized protein YggE